jgi:hypothetical protein
MSEDKTPIYYEGPHPGKDWKETGLEECEIMCLYCFTRIPARIIVGTHKCAGGIDEVVDNLVKRGAIHICDACYDKQGLKRGPLPKVKDK